jgi:oligopeptidase A
MGVKNSPELRKIHDAVQPSIIEAFQRMGQSVPVYTALKSIREDVVQWSALDTAQRRIVLAALRSMETSGIGLSGEKRTRFNKLKLEAAELSTKFSNNVLDSTKVTHFSNSES